MTNKNYTSYENEGIVLVNNDLCESIFKNAAFDIEMPGVMTIGHYGFLEAFCT